MNFETTFFDVCGVCRDRYTADIKKATEAYKNRASEIANGYKGQLAKEQNEQNRRTFEDATQAAKDRAKKDILEEYERAEIKEKAAVAAVTIGADTIKALDGLRGVPMSKEELELVADGVAGKGFWVNAKLRQLAEENGVQRLPGLLPTYTERMEALNIARDRMLEYIESGDIDGLNMNITDRAFRSLESRFSNGFSHYAMDAKKQAGLLMDQAKNNGDIFSTSVFLKNAIETAADDVKAELVQLLSADNSYMGTLRELGGLQKYIEKEEEKQRLDEKQALKLVRDARLAGEVAKLSEAERRAALWGSAVYQGENGRDTRKIDRQGLDFLGTEQGAEKVREFEQIERKASEAVADRIAEAKERARIEGE